MKCPHCNYEYHGHLGDDGKWVPPEKKYGDHFSVETEEIEIPNDGLYRVTVMSNIVATRNSCGYIKEERSVHACASCGILFINTTH